MSYDIGGVAIEKRGLSFLWHQWFSCQLYPLPFYVHSPFGPAYYMLWFLAADYYSKLLYPSLYDGGGYPAEQGTASIKEVKRHLLPCRIWQSVFGVLLQGGIYLVGIVCVLGPVAVYTDA